MKVFIYKTQFSDGRPDFYDAVAAHDESAALDDVLASIRNIDTAGFGTDENASADIICELASDPATLVESFTS